MAGRRAGAGLALAAIALSAASCGSTKTVTTTVKRTVTHTVTTTRTVTQPSAASSPCGADQVSGTFDIVPGSQGAGQVTYLLTLLNGSAKSCSMFTPLDAVLLDASGAALPTHITGPVPTAVLLPAGSIVTAHARFSPSVPGDGDSTSGPCQPKAHTLRITNDDGGTIDAPIKPPTSVCQGGTLNFDVFALR